MTAISRHTAQKLTPIPGGKFSHFQDKAVTADIIRNIQLRYNLSKGDTKELAQSFKRRHLSQTLASIHNFVRSQIRYKLDPQGWQYIKSPAQTISDGFGDCKAYSILIGSVLYHLGIPFAFRYVSYEPGDYTHVYIVAGPQKIPVDACIPAALRERKYFRKKDIMTKITHVSGPETALFVPGKNTSNTSPAAPKTVVDLLQLFPIDQVPEGLMVLVSGRERLALEKAIMSKRGLDTAPHQDAIDALDDALGAANNPAELGLIADDLEGGLYQVSQSASVRGIGSVSTSYLRRQARNERALSRRARLSSRAEKPIPFLNVIAGPAIAGFFQDVAGWIRDAAKAVGQGVKTVGKVLTEPIRLVARGIIGLGLPAAGPFFLYLFWKASELPPGAMPKRIRAEKIRSFIVDVLGMKFETFMRLARNGIMKQTGKTPKELMMELQQSGAAISGPLLAAWAIKAFANLSKLVLKILGVVKNVDPATLQILKGTKESDSPDPEDWKGTFPQTEEQLDPTQPKEAGLGSFALPTIVLGGIYLATRPSTPPKKKAKPRRKTTSRKR